MGEQQHRRQRFLAEHPLCIFCAGDRPATTEDHVPGRAFFEDRQWPEGYVFPACETCNAATRHDEQLLAFLSFLNDPRHDSGLTPEWTKLKAAVVNNHPRIFRRLLPSANDVRRALRQYGIERKSGVPLNEHPIVLLPIEELGPAIERFGFKLGSALHYRFAHRALIGRSGGVLTHFWTNLDVAATGIPPEVMAMAPFSDQLKRATHSFDRQFEVRAATGENGAVGLYAARFRASFTLILIVATRDIEDVRSAAASDIETDRSLLGRPFGPYTDRASGSR